MTVAARSRVSVRLLVNGLVLAFAVAAISMAALERIVPLTGHQTLVIAGPSMVPAIALGSVIVIEPVAPASLVVGDIVSLKTGPETAIITHRVVRLIERGGELWLETRGDANRSPDASIIPASDVIGRLVVAVPYVGYLVALASRPIGVVLIVAVGLLLLTVSWILDPRRSMVAASIPA